MIARFTQQPAWRLVTGGWGLVGLEVEEGGYIYI